jgi:hypothetical protein
MRVWMFEIYEMSKLHCILHYCFWGGGLEWNGALEQFNAYDIDAEMIPTWQAF